jgi:hypothetical protein
MRKVLFSLLSLLAVRAPLDVRGSGWAIAGIRRYRNGNSAFTLEVTARIPRG